MAPALSERPSMPGKSRRYRVSPSRVFPLLPVSSLSPRRLHAPDHIAAVAAQEVPYYSFRSHFHLYYCGHTLVGRKDCHMDFHRGLR